MRSGAIVRMPVRVLVQQPGLPLYRVPVFRELNRCAALQVRVAYGASPSLQNATPDGFEAWRTSPRQCRVFGRTLVWDQAQWDGAAARNADVVVLSWNLNYLSLIPAIARARAAGVGAVLWGHGRAIGQTALRSRLRALAARLATTVIFYGRAGADENIAMGLRPERVFVAFNSLDERPAKREAERIMGHPEELKRFQTRENADPRKTVLFVSRLHPANRLDLLCEAIPRVARAIPEVNVVVIGKGDAERQRLESRCASLGIESRVRFLGQIYDEADLAYWFLSASALCYPENVGLSALHAFAYGLPVICGDDLRRHNPEAEAVVDQVSGRLFRHGDVVDLARVLIEVLQDSDQRQRLSDGASKAIEVRYNIGNMTTTMAAAIEAAACRRFASAAS